jgi:hypothetical protein
MDQFKPVWLELPLDAGAQTIVPRSASLWGDPFAAFCIPDHRCGALASV